MSINFGNSDTPRKHLLSAADGTLRTFVMSMGNGFLFGALVVGGLLTTIGAPNGVTMVLGTAFGLAAARYAAQTYIRHLSHNPSNA